MPSKHVHLCIKIAIIYLSVASSPPSSTTTAELLLSLSSFFDHSSHFSVPVNSIVSSTMSQNQATVAYPPPPTSTYPGAYSAPPPAGYPTMNEQSNQQNRIPVETQSRGDGFWKGCCAALCCCCVLDACF